MNLARFAIEKRLVSVMATLLILFGGWFAYSSLPRFEDPAFLIRQAKIVTPYPGATALQVAGEVTAPLENALQQLQGIEELRSTSLPGRSEIMVEFGIAASKTRSDLNQRFAQMRARISDSEGQLPPNAGPAYVFDDFGDVYAQYYAITGDGYSLVELHDYAKQLQRQLVLVDGVSKVVIDGDPEQVIHVEYVPTRLAQLGISATRIAQVLQGQNLIDSAGSAPLSGTRIELRPDAAIETVAAIEALVISDPASGTSYHLGDIATVTRGEKEPPGFRLFSDGRPAISLAISNRIGGNVVEMGAALDRRMAELLGERPLGIDITPISDQAATVKASVNGFVLNVLVALGIVVATLLVFMGLRSGILMGGILIVTVAGTLIGMYLAGLDMQRISLGALIIALGMLVDNAIVVVEGTLVRVEKGEDPATASVGIVERTKIPLLGGTVIGLLAFSPIGFSPDNTGEYAGSLFWTVTISLLFSWVVAVWLTPYYCTVMLRKGKAGGPERRENAFFRAYRGLLGLALRLRWVTIVLVVLLFASALASFKAVPQGFFPASTRPQFVLDYRLSPETDSRRTARELGEISGWIRGLDGVTGTATAVGGGHQRFMLTYNGESGEPSYGQILIDVADFNAIDALIPLIDAHLAQTYPQGGYKLWKFMLGPPAGSKIEARFTGPDPAVLRDLAERAQAILADAGAIAIKNDWRDQIKTLHPVIDETAARRAGLGQADIAAALRQHFDGETIGVLREEDELRRIVFRPEAPFRQSTADARSVPVYSPVTGTYIPIGQVVKGFRIGFEPYKVRRLNRTFAITAQADPAPDRGAGPLFERVRPAIEALPLPPGHALEWRGEAGSSADAQAGLAATMPFGFGAMAIVVFALFNAVRQPVIIWLTVPLALIGVIYGLVAMDSPLDFMAILAVLSLTGMLIKNAIVLIDETDEQIAGGKRRREAVIDAAVSRVRPVMLGVLTTVLGVVPLLPDPFFRSLAVVIICGLSFATVLTLIVVPVLYATIGRDRHAPVETPAPADAYEPRAEHP